MKSLSSKINESFAVNEAAKVDGREMQSYLDKSEFGSKVKNLNDMKVGQEYILVEYGMNVWMGLKLDSVGNGTYYFVSTEQFDDFDAQYSKEELEDEIKTKCVYHRDNI